MTYQKWLNLSILFFFSLNATSQIGYERSTAIEFKKNGTVLEYALCGGLSIPQFNEADLNNDGFMDLVIFDRSDNKLITLLNNGINGEIDYTYAPTYEKYFPEMTGYLVMRDFNCDGISDIFTPKGFDYVMYYEGGYDENGNPEFTLITEQLKTLDELPILIADTDYPEVKDIDNDGLLDILTFNEDTGGTVNFFKNISSNCGGIDFVKADACWGNFYESGNNAEIILNSCGGGKSELHEIHPGSTLLTIDLDNDGDKELIVGDINSNYLTMLTNGGTADEALITGSITDFPQNTVQVDVKSFPASFHIDVNNDGKKDFLAAPNSRASSEMYRSGWMYIDISNNETPNFNYVTDRFITNETLDYGRESYPAFADINNDGLLDLIVGNFGSFEVQAGIPQLISTLSYYKNIGTLTEPKFEFVTNDFANFGASEFKGIRPTFGDLNGDDITDIVFGLNGNISGTDKNGFVYAKYGSVMEDTISYGESLVVLNGYTDIGQAAAPQLVDVNEDDLLDLLVGTKDGDISYFKNIGTTTTPEFTLINDRWGNLDVKDPNGAGVGYAYPALVKLEEGEPYSLVIGSFDGHLYLYDDIEGNTENGNSFNLVSNNWQNIHETQYSAPTFADLNNDGMLEMICGTRRGGLLYYAPFIDTIGTNSNYNTISEYELEMYPNPSTTEIYFNSSLPINTIKVFDLNGQLKIKQSNANNANVQSLSNGIYIVEFEFKNGIKERKKLIKL